MTPPPGPARPPQVMRLSQMLFSQGFGTRRECAARILDGQLAIGDQVHDDPDEVIDVQGLHFVIDGQTWPFHERALILLHKPAGFECSTKPRHHPGVLSLLPAPLRTRGVQPIGRLDADTTGLLLLTDDGALIHRLTSPKRHVPKVYEVQCRHAVSEVQRQRLLDGVVLDDDPAPVCAVAAEIVTAQHLRLTLTQGRYHQVKRMLAAVGNRVDALHRSAFGTLVLPADLPAGQWRWLDAGLSVDASR